MENKENSRSGDSLQLRRSFGMKESVTITVGQVIGVGLFVTGANVVGLMGNHIILATLAALLITVYPSAVCGNGSCGSLLWRHLFVRFVRSLKADGLSGRLELYYRNYQCGQQRGICLYFLF